MKVDETASISLAMKVIKSGELDSNDVAELVALSGKKQSNDKDAKDRLMMIVVRPFIYRRTHRHTQVASDGWPTIFSPLSIPFLCDRETGLICPFGYPIVARDLLSPMDQSSSFVLGTVDLYDKFLGKAKPSLENLRSKGQTQEGCAAAIAEILAYAQWMVSDVLPGLEPLVSGVPEYNLQTSVLLQSEEDGGMSKGIIDLCDWGLAQNELDAPLFEKITRASEDPTIPVLSPINEIGLHLGYAGDSPKFGLADAQRLALVSQQKMKTGEVLAINGPPGTGKTTLLLSIVATEWIRAAIDGGDPPVIVAASTNNQAVTNVIDAFAKDFAEGEGALAGRWVPEVNSYGCYTNENKARDGGYLSIGFVDALFEPTKGAEFEAFYLERAERFFGVKKTLDAVVGDLQQRIVAISRGLEQVGKSFREVMVSDANIHAEGGYDAIGERLREVSGRFDETAAKIEAEAGAVQTLEARVCALLGVPASVQERYAEDLSFIDGLLFDCLKWMPSIKAKQGARFSAKSRLVLTALGYPESELFGLLSPELLSNWIGARILDIQKEIEIRQEVLGQWDVEQIHTKREMQALESLLGENKRVWVRLRLEWDTLVSLITPAPAAMESGRDLGALNALLDSQVRFYLFRLATHYWEGRWIQAIKGFDFTKRVSKNPANTIAIWKHRMMLTPCCVSTFHSLPKHFKAWVRGEGGSAVAYLTNEVDLLVVDEAGQVSPEVALPSFLLAKKALVVGDTLQIEPVWSIPEYIDAGNLFERSLIVQDGQPGVAFEDFAETGLAASCGSVMKVAQESSRYHQNTDLSRGLYLFEHRRCQDQIIQYCNELCYKSTLIPKRGNLTDHPLPAMGYLHVPGACRKSRGSNMNEIEAEVIAAWLSDNRELIEKHYQGTLEQLVGVVTPFAPQVSAIQAACSRRGIKVFGGTKMTVGTVHAVQGAERKIVLFSPTYSKSNQGTFIDRGPNMLNVATSRAKDSFLVFGDMDIYDPAAAKPSGLLARYLMASTGNNLETYGLSKNLLGAMGGVKDAPASSFLTDFEEHDAFAVAEINAAKSSVMIISPWITSDAMTLSGLRTALESAAVRGVEVTLLYDLRKIRKWLADPPAYLDGLHAQGVTTVALSNVHSKLLMIDNAIMAIGSFNWLSSARKKDHKWLYSEVSFIIRDRVKIEDFIENSLPAVLAKRICR